MPHFIRAKTYYRYADEQLRAAERALKAKEFSTAINQAKEALERACRALWAIVEFEAPKEKPHLEKIFVEFDRAVEPWLAREIRRSWERLKEISMKNEIEAAKEAVDLARFVVYRSREVLEPIIGPPETPKRSPLLF